MRRLLCLLLIPIAAFSTVNEDHIYKNNRHTVLGNPNGRITVVDFADYECGPCRSITRTLNYLAKNDLQLRIISIDYPMLGENSTYAAKAALASKLQGNYLQFHKALMNTSLPLTPETVLTVAANLGLDRYRLARDVESKVVINDLLDNMLLGNNFGVKGLPTFIIGYTRSPHNTTLFAGASGEELLQTVSRYEGRLS